MNKARGFIDDTLAHYASKYYDPQKAHDYYERTKQLSDKNAQSALTSKEQRDAFAVSRDSIATARAAEITSTQAAEKTTIDTLRANAQAAVDRISATLDALAKSLNDSISKVQVNKIPANATPEQKAFLIQQNNQIRARASKSSQGTYTDASRQAQRDRANVNSSLQTAVTAARDSYNTAMATLKQKYINDTATEKQNIHDQIKGKVKKR